MPRRVRVVLLLVVCVLFGSVVHVGAEGAGLVVGYLKGRAFSLDNGTPDQGTPLETGQHLPTPVVVRVDQGSRLELVFMDKSVLRLAGPAMALVRDAFVLPGERVMDIALSRGESWLNVRKFSGSRDSVRLALPASLLETREAQAQVRVGPDRRVMVAVFSGEVSVVQGNGEADEKGSSREGKASAGDAGSLEGVAPLEESVGPLDMGSAARTLIEGEQVLLSLSGRVGEKRTMTPFEQRESTWGAWNMARDAKLAPGGAGD